MKNLISKHREYKEKYPDRLVLYRRNDHYVLLEEDARKASEIFGTDLVAITSFPSHMLDTMLPKLIRHGCRVAISDL